MTWSWAITGKTLWLQPVCWSFWDASGLWRLPPRITQCWKASTHAGKHGRKTARGDRSLRSLARRPAVRRNYSWGERRHLWSCAFSVVVSFDVIAALASYSLSPGLVSPERRRVSPSTQTVSSDSGWITQVSRHNNDRSIQLVIRNLFFNNNKEQNISKAYSYVTSTVQGSDGMCFTLHDSVTRANKKKKEN